MPWLLVKHLASEITSQISLNLLLSLSLSLLACSTVSLFLPLNTQNKTTVKKWLNKVKKLQIKENNKIVNRFITNRKLLPTTRLKCGYVTCNNEIPKIASVGQAQWNWKCIKKKKKSKTKFAKWCEFVKEFNLSFISCPLFWWHFLIWRARN